MISHTSIHDQSVTAPRAVPRETQQTGEEAREVSSTLWAEKLLEDLTHFLGFF